MAAAAAADSPAAAPPPPNCSPFTHPRRIAANSDSNALCKTLIVVILLLAIPLFPSQAPDFITQTVFTDFWEIIHLLFIGIAVSYGLFGRRTAQIAPDKSAADDSRSYLSGISGLTSIFDEGYENVCYENGMLHNYVNFGDQLVGNEEYLAPSGRKIRSLVPNDENVSVDEGNGNGNGDGSRAWRSRYSKGESLLVVSNAKCFHGGSSDFKPLNLPVRSLRSRAMDNHKQEFKNVDEFGGPKFEANKGNGDAEVVVKIRGVVPVNLDKKFEEVSGRTTIPWRSRSGSMEDEEEMSGVSKLPAHSRPHSVGEFEFEHLKSRSRRSSKFPSTPELRSSGAENLEREREMERMFAGSHSKAASISLGAENLERERERERMFAGSHSKAASIESDPFSNSASSDMDSVGDLESNVESSGVEEEVRKGKQAIESLDTDATSSSRAKVLARAKSVRTIKPKRYAVIQKENCPNRGDGKSGRRFIKSEADFLIDKRKEEEKEVEIPPVQQNPSRGDGRFGRRFIKPEVAESLIKRSEEEPEAPPIDHQNQESGRIFSMPKPKPTLPEFHSEENKQDVDDLSSTMSADPEIAFDKCSVEEDTRPNIETDSELGSEVDRKAGEFIAKFREQIRRQKASTSSVEGYSGWQ